MKKSANHSIRCLAIILAATCLFSFTYEADAAGISSSVSNPSASGTSSFNTSSNSSTSSSSSSSLSDSTEASIVSKAPANTQSTSSAASSSASSSPTAVASPQKIYQMTATQAAPLTDIDSPSNGANVSGTVHVSGWVLNASGIDRVDMYAFDSNGKAHGLGSVASKDLTSRTDVAKAFANEGYANINNSGYTLSADMTLLSSGTYTLAVAGIGKNGVVQWATKSIHVTTPQPLTNIDSPSNGAKVSGTVKVSGWVLNASGIDRVDMYAFDSNGKAHGLGSVASKDLTSRTDVAKAFANEGYANINNSGYTLSVDTTLLSSGTYTLAVAGIGKNSVVQWSTASIQVTTPQPLTDIDSPSNGAKVSGTVNVSGWVLNASGINRVDMYAFDSSGKAHSLGSVAGKNLTGRTDVVKAFANEGYANINNSGYTLPVNTTQLSSGTYTLAVAGIGNNSVVQWATASIQVTTPQPLTDIDSPSNGAKVSGTVNVSGWVLNASGINRVDMYAFDSSGKAHSLGSVAGKNLTGRTDVVKAFANEGYANINNSGYTLPVNTTQLSSGTYTLAVAGIGNNSVVQWSTAAFTITGSVTVTQKPFNTTLAKLASCNGVTAGSINPTTLFKDSKSKYEFMSLYGISGITADDINNMLKNCGVLTGQGQAIVDAAAKYNINPVYLAAHMRIESGNGTSKLATGQVIDAGTYTDAKGRTVTVATTGTYYNLLGIHAYDGSALADGSQYAASQNWNSIPAAIAGGAAWISKNYIHNSQVGTGYYDQPTLYEMKWDPEGTARHNAQGSSEYAIDVDWAYGISSLMAQYSSIFVGKNTTFYVAQFN